jgi:annexin A7/11
MSKDRAAKIQGLVAKNDAEALYKAMKGLGTDDKVLIDIFTTRPRKHIQEIKKAFSDLYGKSLESWIKGDCSGHFETILLDLCEERTELKCKYLHKATAGAGTDEDVLIQILCPATDSELKKLDQTYRRIYGTDLNSLIKSEISGDFQKLMFEILKADRPSREDVNDAAAKADAETLLREGEGKIGTNEDVFIDILTNRSRTHIHQVCRHYEQLTGHTLEKAIKSEMSGDFRKALIGTIKPEGEYYAHLFDEAMRGIGTNDNQLVRLMSTLTKAQLKKANEVYTKQYSKTLHAAIKSETSGSYQKTLLGLIPPIV